MSEPWSLAAIHDASATARHGPWCCQMIHHELTAGGLIVDLVALEDCPADAGGCPRATPFTIQLPRAEIGDPIIGSQAAAWATCADLVRISFSVGVDGRRRIGMSSAGLDLVVVL